MRLHRSLVQVDWQDRSIAAACPTSLRNAADLSLQRGKVDAKPTSKTRGAADRRRAGAKTRRTAAAAGGGDPAWKSPVRAGQRAAAPPIARGVELQESLVLADPNNAQQRRRLPSKFSAKAGRSCSPPTICRWAQARLTQGPDEPEELLRLTRSAASTAVVAARAATVGSRSTGAASCTGGNGR